MLIQYVRDSKRNPIGVLVATGYGEIGWSLTNKKDKWNKAKGIDIAYGRAIFGTKKEVPHSIKYDYYIMYDRMERYYH